MHFDHTTLYEARKRRVGQAPQTDNSDVSFLFGVIGAALLGLTFAGLALGVAFFQGEFVF